MFFLNSANGAACSTHCIDDKCKCKQYFSRKTWNVHGRDVGVGLGLILKCISKKQDHTNLGWIQLAQQAWVCGRLLARIAGSNPVRAWMSLFCECCVLSDRDLCVELITRPEEFLQVCCVWVWSRSLENEGALAHYGLLRHKQKHWDGFRRGLNQLRTMSSSKIWKWRLWKMGFLCIVS